MSHRAPYRARAVGSSCFLILKVSMSRFQAFILPLFLSFILVLTSRVVATTYDCHTIQVYNGDFFVIKSVIIANQDSNLTFYIRLDNGTINSTEQFSVQLSSLGVQPLVTVSDSDGETVLDVDWNQHHLAWSVSISVNNSVNCSLPCLVLIQLSTDTSHICVKQWRGSLLNTSEVPLLNWIFTVSESFTEDDAVVTSVSHLQCHADISVALKGYQVIFTENLFQDTSNHFYNICDLAGLSGSQCTDMVIEDIALTYSKLLLLTSNGLLVSSDTKGGSPALVFVEDLPFQTQGAYFIETDPLLCQYPVISQEQVFIAIDGQHQSVFTASPLYNIWNNVTLCSSGCGSDDFRSTVISFNSQQQTYIVATPVSMGTVVNIFQSNGVQIDSIQLLSNVTPTSMHYHSTTASTYIVGSEVWMSLDGGYTFEQLFALPNNESVSDFKLSEQALALLTSSGRLFYGRPASRRLVELQTINSIVLLDQNTSKVMFDSSGQLHIIQFGNHSIESILLPLLEIFEQSVIQCNLTTGLVHQHLIYVLKNDSMCLNGETSIGMVATPTGPSRSLGKGILADIGATTRNSRVGFVMTFDALQPDTLENEEIEWSFQDEECWIQLRHKNPLQRHFYELDAGDHVQLKIESFLAEIDVNVIESPYLFPKQLWDISILIGNPEVFELSTTIDHHFPKQTVTIDIWQKSNTHFTPFYSTVTFQLIHCPLVCERCTLTTVLSSSCPSNKLLLFSYPTVQQDDRLYQLPANYRPPSHLGVAISTSPHVYNANPALPLMNSQFSNSRAVAQFKQCAGADTISNCACSPELETSTDIAFSDCIRKVYNHLYEVEFSLSFVLSLGNGNESVIQHPILIEELNNRTDFILRGESNGTVITPGVSTTIVFTGPGLYHFKSTLLDVISICPLTTQFTVYVDRVPLTKAGEYTVTILTTVLFGTGALLIYLVYNTYNLGSHHK